MERIDYDSLEVSDKVRAELIRINNLRDISRQTRWKLRMKALGRCYACGASEGVNWSGLCERHAEEHRLRNREASRKKNGWKRKYKGGDDNES